MEYDFYLFSVEIRVPFFCTFVYNANFQLIETAFALAAHHVLTWGTIDTSGVLGSVLVIIALCVLLVFVLSKTYKVLDEVFMRYYHEWRSRNIHVIHPSQISKAEANERIIRSKKMFSCRARTSKIHGYRDDTDFHPVKRGASLIVCSVVVCVEVLGVTERQT